MEECSRLLQRHEDLEDKYTQLKQASSAEVQDLQRRLTDALESEKVQLQSEKVTKKNGIGISFFTRDCINYGVHITVEEVPGCKMV